MDVSEELAGLQVERDAAQAEIQTLAEEAAGLKAHNDRLKPEMDELKERIDRLEQAVGEAECPLCGQELSDEHREQLLADLHCGIRKKLQG